MSEMSDAQRGGVKKLVTFLQMERTDRPTRCHNVGGGRDQAGIARGSSPSDSEEDSNTEAASGSGGKWMLEK